VEQVRADWASGPLAHLPSGSLASLGYAKALGATIRRDLIDVAARIAQHGHGHVTLHLPEDWHREHEWLTLFAAAGGPSPAAA
jgi:hypothetical protein